MPAEIIKAGTVYNFVTVAVDEYQK